MDRLFNISLLMLMLLFACESDSPNYPTSGEATINNTLIFDSESQSYFLEGFCFARGRKVSTLSSQDYISVGCSDYVVNIQSYIFADSFYLYGRYEDDQEAVNEFNNLTSIDPADWEVWAKPVEVGQIWIFRTKDQNYAKFLIRSLTISENDMVECSFKWMYQPDGSNTFTQ